MTTLIEGGTVVGFRNGEHSILTAGQVAYTGNTITYVGPDYRGEVDVRIDGRGKLVIPGFVNHHMAFGVHMQLFRLDAVRPNFFNSGIGLGVQPEKAYSGPGLQSGDWRASAQYAMASALRTGTTTFVMVPNYGRHPYRGRIGTDAELVQTVTAAGLRAYLALPYMSGSARGKADGTIEWVSREAEGWQGLEQAVEFARAFDGAGEGRIRAFLFPYQADNSTPDLLRASKAGRQCGSLSRGVCPEWGGTLFLLAICKGRYPCVARNRHLAPRHGHGDAGGRPVEQAGRRRRDLWSGPRGIRRSHFGWGAGPASR